MTIASALKLNKLGHADDQVSESLQSKADVILGNTWNLIVRWPVSTGGRTRKILLKIMPISVVISNSNNLNEIVNINSGGVPTLKMNSSNVWAIST